MRWAALRCSLGQVSFGACLMRMAFVLLFLLKPNSGLPPVNGASDVQSSIDDALSGCVCFRHLLLGNAHAYDIILLLYHCVELD
jgi:hypothetical protein